MGYNKVFSKETTWGLRRKERGDVWVAGYGALRRNSGMRPKEKEEKRISQEGMDGIFKKGVIKRVQW